MATYLPLGYLWFRLRLRYQLIAKAIYLRSYGLRFADSAALIGG